MLKQLITPLTAPPRHPTGKNLTNGGNSGHDLAKLQFVQDCCLTSRIKSDLSRKLQVRGAGLNIAYKVKADAACWTGKRQLPEATPCQAAAKLTISILISFLEKSRANNLVKASPMMKGQGELGYLSGTPKRFYFGRPNQGPSEASCLFRHRCKSSKGYAESSRAKQQDCALRCASSDLSWSRSFVDGLQHCFVYL